VALIDTPGFMVGPEVEARAQVRHASRLFVVSAQLAVPYVAVVLRKGYGLGAMALAGGSFHAPRSTIAWPCAEFGAMGLQGAVKLGFRKELEALPEGPQRQALFERLLAELRERGSALNMAAALEIDAVIDPAQTRDWLAAALSAARPARGARFVDPW
ncbi:MAG: biotin carboxylase, partial [Burkholderiaceae bacterium]|nr:biotin carboxylase [Burkholderiaceae bacterium]